MRILVINGPNLGRLGKREPEIYGRLTLEDLTRMIEAHATALEVDVDFVQNDEEGVLVRTIGETDGRYDGIILNPGGYTHTSVALRDALQACPAPCVEVHLSNIHTREEFRHTSLTAGACIGQVMGFGAISYTLALTALAAHLAKTSKSGE